MVGQITYNHNRVQRIGLALEEGIRESNRCLYKWYQTWQKDKTGRISSMTQDDVRSLFNGWFKKLLKHHLNDDVSASRFLSQHKPFIGLDSFTHQINSITFINQSERDHPLLDDVKKALSFISYGSLFYYENSQPSVEISNTNTNNEINISFDSIESIKF